MKRRPLILMTPYTERRGSELGDDAVSLSNRYMMAVVAAGGVPGILPLIPDTATLAELVRRADGLVLTGGEDVQPGLYAKALAPALRRKVKLVEPERDLVELMLVREAIRQQCPILAICRGHQMLNVALGGTLVVDIPTQVPGCVRHRRLDRRFDLVHDVAVQPGSRLAGLLGESRVGVNSTHHQAVDRVAPTLLASARADDGVVEAMEPDPAQNGGLPWVLSVQFHPERLYDRYPPMLALFNGLVRAAARRTGRTWK